MDDASDSSDDRPILVGIKPGMPPAVISVAEEQASGFGCDVVFAYVELNSALIELDPEGVRTSESLDPDVDDEMASIVRELRQTLADAFHDSPVRWSLRTLGGDPASALSRLAVEVDARVIVVGSRHPGIIHRVEELFSKSVAASLITGQTRPVLVVPAGRR